MERGNKGQKSVVNAFFYRFLCLFVGTCLIGLSFKIAYETLRRPEIFPITNIFDSLLLLFASLLLVKEGFASLKMLPKITQGAHFKKTITGLSSMFVFIVMLFLALTLINPFWLP